MRFAHRSAQAELMDTEVVEYEQFHACLKELETINGWTLAYGPTLRWLARFFKCAPQAPITILDIGSGGGDMLRRIAKRFDMAGMTLIGIDINPHSKRAAEAFKGSAPIVFETCDIFDFPADRRADVIISSLFTHHLDDEQLVRFVRWMEQHATRGWFINDLHRHVIPYHFIKLATALLSRNHLIRNDAAVSVSRAFTRADWQRLLASAGIPKSQTRIRWYLPFRYCVERVK